MDYCTFLQFRDCVRNPKLYFRTLGDISLDDSSVACTEHFVECIGELYNCRYMLYAPLTIDAIHYANRAAVTMSNCNGAFVNFKVLKDELLINNHFTSTCSIVVENLPHGTLLSEAMYTFSYSHLMQGLNNLKRRMAKHNICHSNLNPNNIIVDDNYEWHPIRWYYAVNGKRKNYKEFKNLAERIKECSIPDDYAPQLERISLLNGLDYPGKIFPLKERRRRVITDNGTGFVDQNNNLVIKDIYRHATDFMENRSIVTTKSGLKGIINRNGDYIIPPEYDDIIFDINSGDSKAYRNISLTIFDYLGEVKM